MRLRIRLCKTLDADLIEYLKERGPYQSSKDVIHLLRVGHLAHNGTVGELIAMATSEKSPNVAKLESGTHTTRIDSVSKKTSDSIEQEASVDEKPKSGVNSSIKSALLSSTSFSNLK